ncbi:MAG: amidohydrolase [Alistipes sp.]|nr:amidohydrolase [Alistipes sp.]MDE7129686.1 amidohydrolase [Alistipes sp.]
MGLRVAVCQYDIEWYATQANLARVDDMLSGIDADLIVLPEMFQTGFVTDVERVAETMEGETVAAMRRWAERSNAAIAGGAVIRDGGVCRNRLLFVEPSGRVSHTDKRHLFSPSNEHKRFEPGRRRTIVEWRGVRFLLQICYDLRFPVWSRNRGDYDAVIYSALWPAPRQRAWTTLLAARAIENQCYAIGVNRTGDEPGLHYAGGSRIVDFRGDEIVALDEAAGVAVGELDLEPMMAFREKFTALHDADRFEIEL